MTTQPKKAVKSGHKPLVTIQVPIITIRKRIPLVPLVGNPFLDLSLSDTQGLRDFVEGVQKQVQDMLDIKQQIAYVLDDIYQVLDSPDWERKEGKRTKGPDGRYVPIERPRKDRRLLDQVRKAMDDALNGMDKRLEDEDRRGEEAERQPFEIEIKADAAICFCERMIQFYEEYIGAGIHVEEAVCPFEDKLAEAKDKWRAYEKGEDEVKDTVKETEKEDESKE